MCCESFCNPCRLNDKQFVVGQKPFTSQKVKKPRLPGKWTHDKLVAHLEQELLDIRSEAEGKLPSPKMVTTKTHQNHHRHLNEQTRVTLRKTGSRHQDMAKAHPQKEQKTRVEKQTAGRSTAKTYTPSSHCERTDRISQTKLNDPEGTKSKSSSNS